MRKSGGQAFRISQWEWLGGVMGLHRRRLSGGSDWGLHRMGKDAQSGADNALGESMR